MSLFKRLLGVLSGGSGLTLSQQLLFDNVIGFKGIVPGVGASTLLQNVAVTLEETTNYSICVLDMNFQFPSQYSLLGGTKETGNRDILEFSGDVADITAPTGYRKIRLASIGNRSIVDMFSPKDDGDVFTALIAKLKAHFDVILVDLSHELTQVNTTAAIKCNKIFLVADPSIKCMHNLRRSLNTQATLAVSPGKMSRVVLNKVVPEAVTSVPATLQQAGLTVVGEIPLSNEIAKAGISGKPVVGGGTFNRDIQAFTAAVGAVVGLITQKTPLSEMYHDPVREPEVVKAREELVLSLEEDEEDEEYNKQEQALLREPEVLSPGYSTSAHLAKGD